MSKEKKIGICEGHKIQYVTEVVRVKTVEPGNKCEVCKVRGENLEPADLKEREEKEAFESLARYVIDYVKHYSLDCCLRHKYEHAETAVEKWSELA